VKSALFRHQNSWDCLGVLKVIEEDLKYFNHDRYVSIFGFEYHLQIVLYERVGDDDHIST